MTDQRSEELTRLQRRLRNLAVIAHVDHGKSTLSGALLQSANAGNIKTLDNTQEEQDRGITINATGIALEFPQWQSAKNPDLTGLSIGLIDSPGHADFNGEVTASLRLSDGAILVVDPIDSKNRALCPQTETVLRQALAERVRPVLFLNKIDRLIAEVQMEPEQVYALCAKTIDAVNAIIEENQPAGMDFTVSPVKGNVAFGSGLENWAFTLGGFARLLAKGDAAAAAKLTARLWGENYLDGTRWTSSTRSADGSAALPRGFCQLVLKPIMEMFAVGTAGDKARLQTMAAKLGVTMTETDVAERTPKQLRRQLLNGWIPMAETVLRLVDEHLPSPLEAQAYRAAQLYEGEPDDEFAQSMQRCDPQGPLMVYISKLFAPRGTTKSLTAYGRVFSGTVRAGDEVLVCGPAYVPGDKADSFKAKVRDVVTVMGGRTVRAEAGVAGQVIGLEGIDRYLAKTGCVLGDARAHRLRVMQFSVTPIVQLAVRAERPADALKVAEKLQLLAKSDPCLRCFVNEETQEMIMAGAGELHLEVRLHDLMALCGGITVRTSEPVVQYNECVTSTEPQDCMAKSANGHNALHVRAQPLSEALVAELEAGTVSMGQALLERVARLSEHHGWDREEARRIVAIEGTNILLDATTGISIADIRENVVIGFREVCNSGVVAGEPLRGVRFNIFDAKIHGDPVHRRADSIVPMTRKVLSGAVLMHEPRLVEPVFRVSIALGSDLLGAFCRVMKRRRGEIAEDVLDANNTTQHAVTAFLPVAESFGLAEDLRGAMAGRAFPQITFDHWQVMPESPLQPGTRPNTVAVATRRRKALAPEPIPTPDLFLQHVVAQKKRK